MDKHESRASANAAPDDQRPTAGPAPPPGEPPFAEPPVTEAGEPGATAETGVSAESTAAVQVPTSPLGRAIAELQEAQRAGHERLLRLAADAENFRKRSRKELSEAVRRAEEKTVQEFLPVIDNLERALSHAEPVGGLLEGVRMVHKQFLAVLERFGVKPFDSVGQPFDPERHEAIQQAASELPPGTVCQEAQRGYLRGDRLVRPAMVVVSVGPVAAPPAGQAERPAPPDEESGGASDGSGDGAT